MPFPLRIAVQAMIDCGRSCCLCNKYCGTKIECHHITPESEGGEDTYDNCIPLCFDCHEEVGAYNPKHPKGRKFTPEELKGHRNRWYGLRKAAGGPSDPAQTVITPEDVLAAFKAIPDFTEDAVRNDLEDLHTKLLKNGIATRKQLFDLATSGPILNTIRGLYIELLKRPIDKPLDPMAVVVWGSALYNYGIKDEVLTEIHWLLRQSPEYAQKNG